GFGRHAELRVRHFADRPDSHQCGTRGRRHLSAVPAAERVNVRTPADALRVLLAQLEQGGTVERIPTRDALDRVLAEALCSPADLPAFRRSTMDGFAVRAADTFGATEG